MAARHVRLTETDGRVLREGFAAIRRELEVPETFPPEVLDAARAAAERPVDDGDRTDLRATAFFTLDPPGSMDLDQAMFLERTGTGFVVRYAIADVASFVATDGPVDAEARRRGETLYSPDTRTPLHPPVLSEGAASLLPDQDRRAVVWTLTLDGDGELTGTHLERALVRSCRRLDYAGMAGLLAGGDEQAQLLAEIGRLRVQRGVERGAVDLPIPEQEVEAVGGGYRLTYREVSAADRWNAQISLLTGMAAARIMLDGRIGILRTLPPAPESAETRLRATAASLGVDWPAEESFAALVPGLDPSRPAVAALVQEATVLLRGAGYTAFDGELPKQPEHAAVAAPYSHVTAPLRRLVDRFATEVVLALVAGRDVDPDIRAALPELPALMSAADERAGRLERACLDLVEATVLQSRVGEEFAGSVVDIREGGGTVLLRDEAVRAPVTGEGLRLGEQVRVRLTEADPERRSVRFSCA
ncbi:MAG: RNB domain-containing ribonuclease [Actinomycetales bacterium]